MSIQEYVTSLPVSKRLAPHLPVGWESEFYWVKLKKGIPPKGFSLSDWFLYPQKTTEMLRTKYPDHIEHISAPILSEMLELLPKRIEIEGEMRGYYLQVNMFTDRILIGYTNIEKKWMDGWIKTKKDNVATAAAELFLWVKENGHIKEGA